MTDPADNRIHAHTPTPADTKTVTPLTDAVWKRDETKEWNVAFVGMREHAESLERTLSAATAESAVKGYLMAGCVLKRGEPLAYEALAVEIAALRAQLAAVTERAARVQREAEDYRRSYRYIDKLHDEAKARMDSLASDLRATGAVEALNGLNHYTMDHERSVNVTTAHSALTTLLTRLEAK